MELSKIMSIAGKPGLFKHIAQSKTSIIVESIIDGKRTAAFPSEQISTLSDISIYTEKDDVKLEDVLKTIYQKEDGKKTIDFKSSDKEVISYFESILPDYDKDRVYISDIKKVLKWYNLLIEHNILEFKEEDTKEEETKEELKEETKTETKAKPKTEKKDETKKEIKSGTKKVIKEETKEKKTEQEKSKKVENKKEKK